MGKLNSKRTTNKFKSLKRVLQNEIYSYLNFEDFKRLFNKLDKRFMIFFFAKDKEKIKHLIMLHLFKEAEKLKVDNYLFITKYFEELSKKVDFDDLKKCSNLLLTNYLPIVGYKTDGGYEKKEIHYKNIFCLNPKTYYCSKPMYINLNVFGSLCSILYDENKLRCISNSEIGQGYKSINICYHFLKNKVKKREYKLCIEDVFDYIVNFDDEDNNINDKYNLYHLINLNKYRLIEDNVIDDSRLLQEFPNNDMMLIKSVYLRNTAEYYTCPAKTLLIFIHDRIELSHNDQETLNNYMFTYDFSILNQAMPQKGLSVIKHSNCKNMEYVEFDTIHQRSLNMNVKVLLWINFKKLDHFLINLKQLHLGKFVIIKFIDKYVKTIQGGNNMDFSKILFFGNFLKLTT